MTAAKETITAQKSACILCSINCGLEIQTGGKDGRELLKIKGDKENPCSEGYLCNKAARLNHYQMGADRIDTPMRRRADGTYEAVDWATAIREVSAKLQATKSTHGGEKILFIGGGGQGNHLGGVYANALTRSLGVKFTANALSQEKTGEFWVLGKMFGGAPAHGDFEHAEVAVFLGKNPWQAHGFPQTRKIIRDIAKDPERCLVVIDPALTDSAKMADEHIRLRPGTDAWLMTAMIAVILQEGLEDRAFIEEHTAGFDKIRDHFLSIDVPAYAAICDVEVEQLRRVAQRIATSQSTSLFEDLGIQQNVNSTVVSYLQRVMWVICGQFAKEGAHNISVPFLLITDAAKQTTGTKSRKTSMKPLKVSPVLGRRVIAGLIPCNEIPDEILTDHPDRFRAAIIQSSNPVHSYADSERMRQAMRALDFSVVIDVAMTETAKQADYVLPCSSIYEKHECTFFLVEFPRNFFHLRQPIVPPLPGTLTEAEIHTRILEEMGVIKQSDIWVMKTALKLGRRAFAGALAALFSLNKTLIKVAPILLYRSLGPTLDKGRAAVAAPFWGIAHQYAQKSAQYAHNAGFKGSKWDVGEAIFDAVLKRKSGFFFAQSNDYSDTWNRLGYADKRIRLHLEELFPHVQDLDESALNLPPEFPLILSAGNRRADTQNTIIRDASWDKKGDLASLFIHPDDAKGLGLVDGDDVKIITKTGSAVTFVEVNDVQRQGTIALPNGIGLDYQNSDGTKVRVGVATNELTSSDDKDFFAATPWHKFVPARLEKINLDGGV